MNPRHAAARAICYLSLIKPIRPNARDAACLKWGGSNQMTRI
jgi:hypothetical protein